MKASTPPDSSNERYVPGHGDPSFDVLSYDLVLDYSLESNHLAGRAVITAVARQEIERFSLDLHHLQASKVKIDASPVAKFAQRRGKLVVRPRSPLSVDQTFTVAVTYSGVPQPMPGLDGDAGWEELADGVIVASQPHGAPSWFPCNDRPDDKATYRFEVSAPTDYVVVANGSMTSRRRRAGATTWVYEEPSPMATYLATLQVGRYVSTPADDSDVPMVTIHPPDTDGRHAAAFSRQGAMMALFVDRFGPYPFDRYSAVVTADELEIPLEAQGLSIFGSTFVTDDWQVQRLIAHELAHQWFGNSLTLRYWRDIWLHEGFACYAEWLWSEESGGQSARQQAESHWGRLARAPADLVLSDPGPDLMFDDRVYKRGALTLHALRLTVGDDAFFTLLRTWSQRHRHGSVTTEMFVDLVDELCDLDAGPFFEAWLRGLKVPELPPER